MTQKRQKASLNMRIKMIDKCKICGIPRYRHLYYEDCGHDFLRIEEGEVIEKRERNTRKNKEFLK